MSKSKKPFVIRGFNVTTEGCMSGTLDDGNGMTVTASSASFDCRDVMTKFDTFTEVTVDKQHEAIVEMTTHSVLHTMSTRNLIMTHPGKFPNPSDSTKELYVVDLVMVTNYADMNDHKDTFPIRSYRTGVRDTLKTWAEKSRVTGRRGWRVNAIKTPTFEYDKTERCVVIRTQVILSTAIFYNDHMSTVNVNFDYMMEQEDLRNLHRALVKMMGGMYNRLKYRHSEIGEGEIV